jgi:hypothetical protein
MEYKKDEAQSESTRSRQVRGNPMKEYRMSCQQNRDQERDNPHVPESGFVYRWSCDHARGAVATINEGRAFRRRRSPRFLSWLS